jgi:regulator of cell morphogenesis and NO signaling
MHPNTTIATAELTPDTTLSAIALRSDAHAIVLDRHKLDFCCQGARSLEEACRAAGVDVERVLAELAVEAAARQGARRGEVEWRGRPPGELIDHIVSTHHAYTRAAIARLTPLAAKVLRKHGDRHPELSRVAAAFGELARDMEPHMTKEERVLFPYIRALASPSGAPPAPFGTVRNPVGMMMREHDRAGELLAEITTATADLTLPADACNSFCVLYAGLAELRLDLMKHMSLENNVLFPQAIALEGEGASVPGSLRGLHLLHNGGR